MKICIECKIEKDLIDFYKTTKNKTGYENKCKKCKNSYTVKNNKKYKEYFKLKSKEWKLNNFIKNKEYQQDYYNKNKEYWIINRKSYNKQWRIDNKEKKQKWWVEKYNNDINFKLSSILRSRLHKALKTTKKSLTITNLLGCNIDELKLHIESQFFDKMNWNNHGKIWEIDHIKPCASFDLTDLEQQKQCFHYTNLQPLFKTTEIAENLGYNNIGNRNKNKN
jgi:hypothetical protein